MSEEERSMQYSSMKSEPKENAGDAGTIVTKGEPTEAKMNYAPLKDTSYKLPQEIFVRGEPIWGAGPTVHQTTVREFPSFLEQRFKEGARDGHLSQTLSHYLPYITEFERAELLESPISESFKNLIEESGNTKAEETFLKALSLVKGIKFKR